MLARFALAPLATLGLVLAAPAAIQADHWHHHHYHVEYRLPFWHERSFFSPSVAQEFADTMRLRGFEVLVVRHFDQFDVRYRLPYWQPYRTVRNHSLAHALADTLLARGYQARVIHH